MRRPIRSVVVVAALVVACGDDGAEPPAIPTATTTLPTPATTVPTPATTRPETESPGVYENEEYGFRLMYPDGWTVQSEAFGSLVLIFSPLIGDDTFAENVNVTVEDLSRTPLDLDQYVEVSLGTLESFVGGFTLVDERAGDMGGVPAHLIHYSGTFDGAALTWVQMMAVHGDVAFVITYTGERDFDHYLDDALTIFDSWEFTR
jgi:hypothetical protein